MFNSIFSNSAAGLEITTALIAAGSALLMGLILALAHKLTTRGTTKGFLVTLVVLPLLTMAVMIMINGNLGTSIAILGAFSLIRFRSIRGNARNLLSIFFAMMIGLSCGMGHVLFGAMITAIGVVAMAFFSFTPILEPNKKERVLKIVVPEDMDYTDIFKSTFNKYTSYAELITSKTTNMGSLYDLTYNIKLKSGVKEKEFMDEIRTKNCNLKVSLSQAVMEEEL
ncbi:MAG: DUF4956 domain-containing protein [Candidatus Saccharibacteria bacterium]|nr:DUF4956 domain-containing protein [Candidatus Saccharibacteria bacterium]